MLDMSAFAPAEPAGEASAPPRNSEGLCSASLIHDRDGLAVPTFWQPAIHKWEKLALQVRQKFSLAYLEALEKVAQKPLPSAPQVRAPAKRFTTEYGGRWGKRQGWKEIERERYDFRTGRHHDLQLGVDLMFDDGDGMIGVQAAGKGERTPHYQRFLERGGPEKAKRRHIRIVYVEFVRGKPDPVFYEEWA